VDRHRSVDRRGLELDQLLGRVRLVGADPVQPVLGRVYCDLAMVPIGFAPEAAKRGGANPGVNLTGSGDALGFLQEALAGVLDGFLDRVRRGLRVPQGKLRSSASPLCPRTRLWRRASVPVSMLAVADSEAITSTGREGEKVAPSLAADWLLTATSNLPSREPRRAAPCNGSSYPLLGTANHGGF